MILESTRIPLRPEGGIKRKIFRLLGIGTNRKPATFSTKDITPPPPTTTSPEKRRKSRMLGLGGHNNNNDSNRDSERLQHVRESKIRQPLDTGDAGSINFSTTSLQNSDRTGGGAGSPVVGAAGGVGAGGGVGGGGGIGGEHLRTDSTTVDNELGQFDSATTSNTSSHSPVETGPSNKPPSTMSQNTAATSFSHTTRPISATPILLPPHSPASPTAPSTSSLHPRMTDDASVLTLASSSKHVRRRNSLDTNASMLAIAPSSRRDSQESMPELDSSEASISGARRSVGSVLSSKFEGGRARSVATGHSVRMGEEDEEMETGDDEDDTHSTGREGERTEKEGLA